MCRRQTIACFTGSPSRLEPVYCQISCTNRELREVYGKTNRGTTEMSKTIEQWLLLKYVNGEFTPLSKPFKTKEQAEKARLKYPERQRKTIGLGVIWLPKDR